MIASISTNYSGRKADLCLFPRLMEPNTPVDMEVSRQPMSIAGASKAAQGFIYHLFVAAGEIAGDPDMGTNFFAKMSNRGAIRYPSDINQAFLIESSKAIDAWNERSKSRPADEQIKRVAVVDTEINRNEVSLSLELTTKSNDVIAFLLPVNWSN
jgi:hypothetical protein